MLVIKNNSSNQKSSNLSNSPENPETSKADLIVNENNETSRFLNNDIGFFNSFYNDKFNNTRAKMKYIKKKRIFVMCLYLSIELKI